MNNILNIFDQEIDNDSLKTGTIYTAYEKAIIKRFMVKAYQLCLDENCETLKKVQEILTK